MMQTASQIETMDFHAPLSKFVALLSDVLDMPTCCSCGHRRSLPIKSDTTALFCEFDTGLFKPN